MTMSAYKEVITNGLWINNPVSVLILGLSPLLAITTTVANAIGLGLATALVLVSSNIIISMVHNYIPPAIRLPAFIMIIGSLVTCAELLMQAYTYQLYQILGIFVPLIVTNSVILWRAESFASKNRVLPSALDGLVMGLGFTAILLTLGGLREIIGQGTLFSDMNLLFGASAAGWKITLFRHYPSFLFVILPPGAFVSLGLIIAARNAINTRFKQKKEKVTTLEPNTTVSKRVRVTGQIS